MSALGQKQTYAVQKPMSALPPIATAKADSRNPPCLLYPQEQTCAVQDTMSAKGQSRTSRHLSITSSARASSGAGTVSPSAFAVLRLIAISNLVGCRNGKSDGFAPLRIRPT